MNALRMAAAKCFLLGMSGFLLLGCHRPSIYEAARRGNMECLKACIERGEDVNQRNADGNTPLHCAAYSGQDGAVLKLIEAGADIEAKNSRGLTPLLMAIWGCNFLRNATTNDFDAKPQPMMAITVLIGRGANVNAYGPPEYPTPLHVALQLAARFPDEDSSISVEDPEGLLVVPSATAAARYQYPNGIRISPPDLVKMLIQKGADCAVRDNDGKTPLDIASSLGMERIGEMLVQAGSPPSKTALHEAKILQDGLEWGRKNGSIAFIFGQRVPSEPQLKVEASGIAANYGMLPQPVYAKEFVNASETRIKFEESYCKGYEQGYKEAKFRNRPAF